MIDRNLTRAQACALGLIENVANGSTCHPLDRELLWDAHGRLLAELERLNAMPSVEYCREERAAGNGGCGACALCCKEARDAVPAVPTPPPGAATTEERTDDGTRPQSL